MSDSLFHGNSRVANNARWLRTIPENAAYLVLMMGDSSTTQMEVVQRWQVDKVDPSCAMVIEDCIMGYLQEVQVSCNGSLRWCTERDDVLTSRKLRCKYDNPDLADELRYEGTAQSVLAQTQAHQQAFVRTFVDVVQYTVKEAFARVEQVSAEKARLEREVEKLRGDRLEAEEELLVAEAGRKGESDELMKRGMDMLQAAVLRQMSPNASPPAPAAEVVEPEAKND